MKRLCIRVVVKLRREVLLIEKFYCVFVGIAFDPPNGGDICNTDKLALHDECKSQNLTNEISDDSEHQYRDKYIYCCKCNYTEMCRPSDSVTLYDEEDAVLYDGLMDRHVISDIVNKNYNKFLTFECYCN